MGDTPKQESPGLAHRIGVTTDGVYQGLIKMASGVGVAVDAVNFGMKKVGLPMGDKPVGGSDWIKGKLTGAYDGYNKAVGVNVPKPVDKTDVVLHAVGDLVGQTAIPIAAAVSKPAAAVTGLKEVAGAVKNAGSYSGAANSTLTDAGTYAASTRAATVAAGTVGVAGAAAKEASTAARSEFKAAAAPAQPAAPAMAATVTAQQTVATPAVATPPKAEQPVVTANACVPPKAAGGSMADKYASIIGENLTSITVPTQVAAAAPPAVATPSQSFTAKPAGMG